VRWRRPQRRYRELLVRLRTLLNGGDRKLLCLRIGRHRKFRQACGIVRALRQASPDYFDREAIRKTRDDARKIIGLIDRLDEALRSRGLAPELRMRLALEVDSDAHAANAPAGRLLVALGEVRELCQAGDDNQPSADQVRIWCARVAFTLMHQFSEEKPTSGSPDSTYRAIAGLLYEILTGERDRDLERACEDHLRSLRSITG
jgi:hypothetical protein